jgi:NAD(P)-dependent dehydrogenase (short-subunit alcohol dehydrogenase family)
MARTVLITGGGTHLGRAMALALAQRDSVVIASRDLERCERVVDSIVALGGDAHAERCDVTDPASVNEMFERTIARTGRLDVVVCNAGGSITGKPFPSTQLEEVRATIDVNLTGSYLCAEQAAAHMIPRRSGVIIFVASIHGQVGSDAGLYQGVDHFVPSGPAYHAAKGGVIQLTRSLAATLGPSGIRVNCVSPGLVPNEATPASLVERFVERTPLRRAGTPDDIASAITFLASDQASWITGQNLTVDGGWTVW